MNRLLPITILGIFALTIPTAPLHAASFNLAPKYEKGVEVHYISRSTIHHRVQVDASGLNEDLNVRTEAGMTLSVMQVDADGNAELQWMLHYIALETTAAVPGISEMLDYDSRKPDASRSPMAPLFARLLERPVTLRVNPAGRVLEFSGLDSGASGGGLAGLVNPLDALAKGFFTKEAFEQLPFFITAQAPSPARPKATWSRSTTIPMPLGVGSLVVDQAFRFQRANRRQKTANIEMSGTISKTDAPGAAGALLGRALTVDRGALAGQFVWDLDAGQVITAETRLQIQSTLDSPLGRMQLAQDMLSSLTRSPRPRIERRPSPPPVGEPARDDPARGPR
jgi:hypothetical protein